jgi:ABC-type Zn uptake system ZnuABC Zn-binding protein ZnuA
MKKYLFTVLITILLCISQSWAVIKIAASIPDLGSIASYIGGDKVEVFSIAKNNSNPHFVEVLPSYMIKVSRAAVYLKVGLALDQWADQIIDGSRNNKLTTVDCSNGISVLDKPSSVTAAMGDVHPQGNPHYWLKPSNGIVIANNIVEALRKIDPKNSSYYEDNYKMFKNESDKRIADWRSKMLKIGNHKVISYHSSWVYFASAFKLDIIGNVEPLPGIPPTGKHLEELIKIIKADAITILLQEPYFPDEAPQFLSRQTGIKVFKFAPSCSDIKPDSYLKHFDEMIDQLQEGK